MRKKIKGTLFIFILVFVCFLTACSNLTISIGFKKQEMYVGDELQLQVNIDDMEEEVEWTSTDEKIATVSDDGLVKALKAGAAYIVAKSGENESKVYLIVKEKSGGPSIETKDKSIAISGNQTIALESSVNQTSKLTAIVVNKETADKVIWESSDIKVATVSDDGLVTGVSIGVVTIKAYLESDPTVNDSLPIIVRSADGKQNIIENYIITKTYVVEGSLDLTALNDKVVNVANQYADSIVGISNYKNSTPVIGGTSQSPTLSSVGSAVILNKEPGSKAGEYKYTAITNNHVVKDNTYLKAYLGDLDVEVDCTLIKTDADVDLAIVTFETSRNYNVIALEEVDNYNVGDFVIAVGCPTGYDYYGSLTFGVISYKNRVMSDEKAVFLQHDAAINPGNSGGALLNLDGKLIGINTLKIATTEVEGMGFAVSMKTIMEFLNGSTN